MANTFEPHANSPYYLSPMWMTFGMKTGSKMNKISLFLLSQRSGRNSYKKVFYSVFFILFIFSYPMTVSGQSKHEELTYVSFHRVLDFYISPVTRQQRATLFTKNRPISFKFSQYNAPRVENIMAPNSAC